MASSSSGTGCTAVSAHFMVCIKDINCNAETRLNLFYILAISQHHARYRPNFRTTENELYPTCIYHLLFITINVALLIV